MGVIGSRVSSIAWGVPFVQSLLRKDGIRGARVGLMFARHSAYYALQLAGIAELGLFSRTSRRNSDASVVER